MSSNTNPMTATYSLDDFYTILKGGFTYTIDPTIYDLLASLNSQITPLFIEKTSPEKRDHGHVRNHSQQNHHHETKSRKYGSQKSGQKSTDQWSEYSRTSFKPTTVVQQKEEGVEKWIQDIRFCLNKISEKNYENSKQEIFQNLDKCVQFEGQSEETKDENIRKIILSIFQIASTNKFYASVYAKLYKELMAVQPLCQEILLTHVNNYTNSVKDIQYVDPDVNYEQFCANNKVNDARKAMCVFFVCLMKENILPVLRVLNIIVAFQTLVLEFIEQENKTNEVDEITEILFLFLQEGRTIFSECKAEWIWKFVIKQNIETLAKYKKNEKTSLSSRAIFKYMDMAKMVKE